MSTSIGIPERVTAGAALLDQRIPDWRQRVDPEILDMSHPSWCVLGLLGVNYQTVASRLGLSLDSNRVRLGFFCDAEKEPFEHPFESSKT